ncbi:hypothetical protein [Enterobacter hormaechei]|uniref:hypothetical protein n=1 Tax=Enterobacter hormaechei TaxID=158836 RepID=UPI003F65999A
MTTNKPMTGEQLDELMTVAVNMQRDSEKVSDRPAAMFAYAVQVAVLELRKVRNEAAALAAENAGLKNAITAVSKTSEECEINGDELKYVVEPSEFDALTDLLDETPATDALLAEMRAQAHKEGAHFVANRMLAAWEAGFIDDTAKNAADIARMILTSTEFMADAPEGDFDRSFADGVLENIAVQLRKEAAQ